MQEKPSQILCLVIMIDHSSLRFLLQFFFLLVSDAICTNCSILHLSPYFKPHHVLCDIRWEERLGHLFSALASPRRLIKLASQEGRWAQESAFNQLAR